MLFVVFYLAVITIYGQVQTKTLVGAIVSFIVTALMLVAMAAVLAQISGQKHDKPRQTNPRRVTLQFDNELVSLVSPKS